jgi:hypothetical protein
VRYDQESSLQTVCRGGRQLALKRATIRVALQPKVAGDHVASVFRPLPSFHPVHIPAEARPAAHHGIGANEFELSCVQAWALAQRIIDESAKRAPPRV